MKKKEILIIGIFCVIAIIGYFTLPFFNKNKSNVSVKNAKGEVLLKFDINEDNYYTLQGEYGIFNIEVKDNKCRAIDVECPNHTCEHTGWISNDNPVPIVCIPNNIVITIDE